MRLVSPETTDTMLVDRAEGRNFIHNYFGVTQNLGVGAQAYLVDMPDEGSHISPHYHDVDQYQVVVAGSGTIGPHPLRPVTFQYADAFTPYGPIIAHEDGLSFYTLRMSPSAGHYDMPAARHLMKARPGRGFAGAFDLKGDLPSGEVVLEVLEAPDKDGVGVCGLRLGPNTSGSGMDADAGGQYCIVCAGSVIYDDTHYPPLSLILVEAGDPTPELTAAGEGAEILIVQFPRATARLGSDPAQLATRDMKALYYLPEKWLREDAE